MGGGLAGHGRLARLIISGSKTKVTGSLNASPPNDKKGFTPTEALEHQLNNKPPSSPFLKLGVTLTLDVD